METLKRLDEHISALIDDELPEHELGLAMAALSEAEGRLAWRAYHLIGDALRGDASGARLGEGFNSRLAARLEAEVPLAVGHAVPHAPASAPAAAAAAAPLPALAAAPGR